MSDIREAETVRRRHIATMVSTLTAQYEKQFSWKTIRHRRNHERDMLVALAVFVRKHGRAALGFTR